MPKRKEPELDPKEQFKRFQQAAKEHEVEPDTADKFFSKLTRPKEKTAPTRQKRSS